MRLPLVGTVVTLLALVLASGAGAATRYVATGGGINAACLDPADPCGSIPFAVSNASSGDTIQIGPGLFPGTVTVIGKSVELVGAGPVTVIQGDPGGLGEAGKVGVALAAGGAIRSLRVEGGAGGPSPDLFGTTGGIAIFLSSPSPATVEIEDVEAISGPPGAGGLVGFDNPALWVLGTAPLSVDVRGGSLRERPGGSGGIAAAVVYGQADATFAGTSISGGTGVNVGGGGKATLAGASIEGGYGAAVTGGDLLLSRSRVAAESEGIQLYSESGIPASAVVADSLVTSSGPAASLFSGGADGKAVALSVRGSTMVGGDSAVLSAVAGEPGDGPVTIDLQNSIAHYKRLPDETPTDLYALRGTITAAHSVFSSSTAVLGGSVPAPGSDTNLDVDPQFVDPAAGDYALQPASPLIDRGDPAIVAAGELDLAGNPRSLDGNGDCIAAPDIGAFELTGHGVACASDAPPTVSGFRVTNKSFAPKGKAGKQARARAATSANGKRRKVKRGTAFVYRLSEEAGVRIAIERRARGRRVGKGRKARCVKPRRGKTKPRCARFVRVGALSAQKGAGRQRTPFSGRLRGKPLAPGRYRATIVATDSVGQTSTPRRAAFTVVRP